MKKRKEQHFVLSSYADGFGIKTKRIFHVIITINGFWLLRSYKRYYKNAFRSFKNAMLYQETSKYSYSKLLQNMHYDLLCLKDKLSRQYLEYRKQYPCRGKAKSKTLISSNINYWFQLYTSSRKLRYCYNVQLRYLNSLLKHCNRLAGHANLKLGVDKFAFIQEDIPMHRLKWTGSKLEFLQ